MKLTAGEIAKLLGISRQAVNKRAKVENWKYEEVKEGRGKPKKYYIVEALPSDVKDKLQKCNLNATTCKNATFENATCGQNQNPAKNKKSEIAIENQNLSLKDGKNETAENQPEKLTLSGQNSAESVNSDRLTLLNATNPESVNQSVNSKVTIENQGIKNAIYNLNATENATCEISSENATQKCNQTENATESINLPEWISLPELASILKISKPALLKKANEESWTYREVPTRGGYQKEFLVENLPEEIQSKILEHFIGVPEEFIPAHSVVDTEQLKEWMRLFEVAEEEHKNEARARYKLVKAYKTFRKRNKELRETEAKERFVKAYNNGKINVIEALEAGIHKLTVKTLYRWIALFEEGGLYALLPKHKNKGRKRAITPEMQAVVWSCLYKGIERGKRIYETLRFYYKEGKLKDHPPSYQAFMKWYKEFRKKNDAIIKYILSPDEWRQRYMPAYGDQKEAYRAEYYGQVLMLDSTKADVMCKWSEKQSDGTVVEKQKRLQLTFLIDVYSRDVRFALAERENSYVVVDNLLRKWLLEVGVPEKIVTDNGSVYKSEHFQQVCERFNIELIYCPPYQPQYKAFVERVFGTIATQLFEVLPGYIGHNVAERRRIEARKKWAKKLLRDEDFALEIYLSPEELSKKLNEFIEKRYRKEKHSFGIVEQLILNSPKKPAKIEDERVLDILLARAVKRKLTNKGIRIHNTYYYSQELALYHQQNGDCTVYVRQDLSDYRVLFVFDEKGNFIARAFNHTALGKKIRAEVIAKTQKRVRKELNRQKKEIKEFTKKFSADPYEVLITSFEKEPNLIAFDKRQQEEFENREVVKAKEIIKQVEEAETLARETADYLDPLERARVLIDRIQSGEPISQKDYEWLKNFSKEEKYEEFVKMEVFPAFEELESQIKLA
ncbi:DDE-type integrase/transposase/recombinase [Desulfurobacterium thermolithotrophum]|uniref:DDE-type integrase/transposase/recombinase n=1 Tax=Desulfurobacterium thermolithotrophum TaxID=64160 RepID=UPI0013D2AEB9|nr:DDE-type integrase/transposase/recombinase [Desulfurobacterium thermolithotrophum]